jgi:hypothetical protein
VEEAEAEREGVEGVGCRGGGGGEGGGEGGEGECVGEAAREEAAAEEVEREVRVRGVRGGGERGEEGVEDGQRDAGRVREHGGQAGRHGRRERAHCVGGRARRNAGTVADTPHRHTPNQPPLVAEMLQLSSERLQTCYPYLIFKTHALSITNNYFYIFNNSCQNPITKNGAEG